MLTHPCQGGSKIHNYSCSITHVLIRWTKSLKVVVPNLVLDLKWTPIFELCIVGCGSKNKHTQKTCFRKIPTDVMKIC